MLFTSACATSELANSLTNGSLGSFESLGGKPPESYLNLGIVNDRQGEAKKALDLFRRALERGARSPRLREWIDVKERILEAKS